VCVIWKTGVNIKNFILAIILSNKISIHILNQNGPGARKIYSPGSGRRINLRNKYPIESIVYNGGQILLFIPVPGDLEK